MPKEITKKNLKKTLWKWFSLYVRLSETDKNGFGKCISCGRVHHYKDLDCGHFIPKNKGNAVYFLRENNHIQCPYCNRYLHGNLYHYGKAIERIYGKNKPLELERKAKETVKFTQFYYETEIERYKCLVRELLSEKATF